jgi:DNA-binding LytR/AlgR family response regulator
VPQDTEEIILTGNNKLDILQLKLSDLICVSSADNYVSVSHLVNDVVRTKLLRTTLKKMELQLPELVKVHRSHLINPIHFKEWKDANTLLLTQTEVPVSKNYKKAVLAMNHSSLKTNDSPLS